MSEDLKQVVQDFNAYLERIQAIGYAASMVHFDMSTGAPKGGNESRAKRLGVLSSEWFTLYTSKEMGEFLRILGEHKDELSDVAYRTYWLVNRNYQKNIKIPKEFDREMSETTTMANIHWEDAKRAGDFAAFAPWLEKNIDLAKRYANYLNPGAATRQDMTPYDVLLDEYEPGMTMDILDEYFAKLRERIVPLLKRITDKNEALDTAFMNRKVPVETQRKLSELMMDKIGYNRDCGQLRESEHPFSISFGKYDCRITTHYHEEEFVSNIFSVLHECGHAMYEQNKMDEIADTVLDFGCSNGIHESQSRFYENIIGRSMAFWDNCFDEMKAVLGSDFDDMTKEGFFRAINMTSPTLIRIEADELTYSLHIMIRYELEKLIFNGSADTKDLPRLWNEKVKEYLGIDVPNDKLGVLQDVHWSDASFGSFPSYSLGSAYAAQFYYAMKKEIDIDSSLANGDVKAITAWLADKVHKFGSMRRPEELLVNATGEKFNPDYYTRYLEEKYTKIYGI